MNLQNKNLVNFINDFIHKYNLKTKKQTNSLSFEDFIFTNDQKHQDSMETNNLSNKNFEDDNLKIKEQVLFVFSKFFDIIEKNSTSCDKTAIMRNIHFSSKIFIPYFLQDDHSVFKEKTINLSSEIMYEFIFNPYDKFEKIHSVFADYNLLSQNKKNILINYIKEIYNIENHTFFFDPKTLSVKSVNQLSNFFYDFSFKLSSKENSLYFRNNINFLLPNLYQYIIEDNYLAYPFFDIFLEYESKFNPQEKLDILKTILSLSLGNITQHPKFYDKLTEYIQEAFNFDTFFQINHFLAIKPIKNFFVSNHLDFLSDLVDNFSYEEKDSLIKKYDNNRSKDSILKSLLIRSINNYKTSLDEQIKQIYCLTITQVDFNRVAILDLPNALSNLKIILEGLSLPYQEFPINKKDFQFNFFIDHNDRNKAKTILDFIFDNLIHQDNLSSLLVKTEIPKLFREYELKLITVEKKSNIISKKI